MRYCAFHALLRFYRKQAEYVFFIIFFISVFPYCFINVIISCHVTPFGDLYEQRYASKFVLDHFDLFLLDK